MPPAALGSLLVLVVPPDRLPDVPADVVGHAFHGFDQLGQDPFGHDHGAVLMGC